MNPHTRSFKWKSDTAKPVLEEGKHEEVYFSATVFYKKYLYKKPISIKSYYIKSQP